MRSPLSMLLFVAFAVAITCGLHYYFFARLVRDTSLPAPWRLVSTVILSLLAASIPASFFIQRLLPRGTASVLYWPAAIWMGFMLLLFFSLVATDVVRVVVWAAHKLAASPIDASRRLFLGRVLGGGAATVAFGAGLVSLRNGFRVPSVKPVQVTLDRLPRALDGMKIVQLTDLHVGPTIGREWLEDVVRRVNAIEPDVVAITGDLVDGSVATLRDAVAPLAALKARHGVFFVTGNHEYYSGADAWIEELGRHGVRVLRNERVSVGTHEGQIDLAGVDDYHARGLAPGHGPDLPRALDGRDPERACVLLAHQPAAVKEAARHGVCLQLSGHTHGGQIWPWSYLVRLQQPFVAGLDREGDTQIYVSCGTGYWGPPMRLGADAEITHITLRAAGA